MSGAPSLGQLSQIYLYSDGVGLPNYVWNARACAALALGLNQAGFDALGDEGHALLEDDLSARLADSGPIRSPFVAVLGELDGSGVADGPGPKRGSALMAPAIGIFPPALGAYDAVFYPPDTRPKPGQIPCPQLPT